MTSSRKRTGLKKVLNANSQLLITGMDHDSQGLQRHQMSWNKRIQVLTLGNQNQNFTRLTEFVKTVQSLVLWCVNMEGGCIVGCQLVLLMHPGQSACNGLHCITTSPADWPHTTTCEISFRRAFQLWFPKQQYLHSDQFNLGDLRGVSPPRTSRLKIIRSIVNNT